MQAKSVRARIAPVENAKVLRPRGFVRGTALPRHFPASPSSSASRTTVRCPRTLRADCATRVPIPIPDVPRAHARSTPPRKAYCSAYSPVSYTHLDVYKRQLQSFELTRLSHAANLRKEIATLMDQWLEENSAASVARLLIDRPPTRPPNLRRSVSRQRGSQRSKPVPSDPPPRSSHLRASMTPRCV